MQIFKRVFLSFMALILLWIGGFCVFAASAIMATPQSEEETTDAIVVLTGGKNRIQEGLSLFAQGRALHLFISGVHEDVKKYEILALWDGDHALPPCCVSLGYEATTTTQNAAETRKWIQKQDYSSIRLVTGDYHMMRSLMEMHHALPGVDIYAHPVHQTDFTIDTLHYWELLFSEYHKCMYRWLQLLFTPRIELLNFSELAK
ncbi:MAG: YdcF family protein [Rhodospirillales bacterium]|nr:YdcF family protein [Alphaproteobacteria bacterium]USO06373.1 MAG: YdcF family protein [Rhodospirillales bacterium]